MFKDNGNGTWSMGKPDSDRISTFQLDKEFEEDWGQNRKTKSICTLENGSLVRKTQMSNSNKEIIVKMAKNDQGVTLTQSCGDVKSTRVFHKA